MPAMAPATDAGDDFDDTLRQPISGRDSDVVDTCLSFFGFWIVERAFVFRFVMLQRLFALDERAPLGILSVNIARCNSAKDSLAPCLPRAFLLRISKEDEWHQVTLA